MARRYLRHQIRRLDYFRMIADLRSLGVSVREVSRTTGVPHRTVLDWTEGSRARWEDAEKLVTLWLTSTGKRREDLPYETTVVVLATN